jgi:hypothetical protein
MNPLEKRREGLLIEGLKIVDYRAEDGGRGRIKTLFT